MDLLIKKIGVFAIFGSIFFYVGYPIYILICLSQGWLFGNIAGYTYSELDRLEDEEQSDSD